MNRGGLGARSLNTALQQPLSLPGEVQVERFGWTFCPGDKVMQVVNNYERDVFNGDLGVTVAIDMDEGELTVTSRWRGRDIWPSRAGRAGAGQPAQARLLVLTRPH